MRRSGSGDGKQRIRQAVKQGTDKKQEQRMKQGKIKRLAAVIAAIIGITGMIPAFAA